MTTTSSVQTYSDGDGECSAYSSLPTVQKSSLQLGLRVCGHLALIDFHLEDPSELLYMALL